MRVAALYDIHANLPALEAVLEDVHQANIDRMVGKTRVVNAGSVGEPFGKPGAHWLLLGPDVQLRNTPYDLIAADLIRVTQCPQAQESAEGILHPPSESEMPKLFGTAELK